MYSVQAIEENGEIMKIIKTALITLLILLFILFGVSVFYSFIYSPEYVYRCLTWGVLHLEEGRSTRLIQSSSTHFQFTIGSSEDEKQTKELFEEVLETNELDKFLDNTGTHAFIVIQNDQILYERYSNGAERSSLLLSYSATKSFVSALIGKAIEEGKISSIEDPVTKYIPELSKRDPRFDNLKIINLLMMSSGIKYDNYFFFTSDSSLLGAYPDRRYAVLQFPQLTDEPGRHFWYNDYNPQILGLILERVTGMHVADYLQQSIWQPLGMEYDGLWDLDSESSGMEMMEGGLRASAIDFAKFGRLYLRKGNWDGQTIIPEAWVTESTQEQTAPENDYYPKNYWVDFSEGIYYQYLWWGMRRDHSIGDFYAMGRNGQMIYVSPSTKLIIVRLGERGINESTWYKAAYKFAGLLVPTQ
jgi:CubicO group peptidase (beta-lactamase class C family)